MVYVFDNKLKNNAYGNTSKVQKYKNAVKSSCLSFDNPTKLNIDRATIQIISIKDTKEGISTCFNALEL
jgi:hypothetical protein